MLKAGPMNNQTATPKSECDPAANQEAVDLNHREHPRVEAMKFTRASGSRPLEGYTIKRGIGSGGFGTVYFATSDAGKEVALKHIERNLDVELRGVSQCLNLKHPNLVSLFNIQYDEHGDGWVIMEYVGGESLKDVIDVHPQGMPDELVRSWLSGIAAGTAYLHDHGIVHRDLKPGNIFLDEGLVKIGDYGLSKFISVSRRSGQTASVGTFHYMAPEIGKGIYGKEIDIYALGVLLYEMLTGSVPFNGETSQEIIMKHLTDEPDLNPLPEPYKRVITKALAKDPVSRYSTVSEMVTPLGIELVGTKLMSSASSPRVFQREPAKTGNSFPVHDNGNEPQNVLEPVHEVVPTPTGGVVMPHEEPTHVVPLAATPEIGNRPAAPVPGRAARQRRYVSWQELGRQSLREKPVRQRVTELVGSLLTSGLVIVILGLVWLMLGNHDMTGPLTAWAPPYAWLTLSSLVGAWTVLIAQKHWEVHNPDPTLQRFAMLAMGLGVGLVSFGISQWLLAGSNSLPSGVSEISGNDQPGLYALHSFPQLLSYLGYFAGLFLVLRFWKGADPIRTTRLSLWRTAAAVFWALLLCMFISFPYGPLITGMIAIAVQLSAPWINSNEQARIRWEFQQACV
jgi:serine/threonine protein kinase